MGKFQVSKYAAPSQGGAAAGGLDFGLGTVQGNQFGVDGAGQLIPSNVFPQTIGPGGEIYPGGGSPFLPGGVPMDPAYAGGPGPFWDTSGMPGGGPRGRHGSRIINVNLPKIVTAGQPFSIIVTYTHVGEAFGTYKVKVNIPIFQIMETSPEKRVAAGGQDNIVINLTAPAPLPDAAITGTVELVQTEGNEVTIDSEVITIPTEKMPNPPAPIPPDMPPVPPPVSEPPVMPPPPPVPIPPVLQLIPVTITRGEDGGFQAIIIEASNLDASEPTTLFIYLSSKPHEPGTGVGGGYGQWRTDKGEDWKGKWKGSEGWKSTQTPAGSVSNYAYSYPATVSINGMTGAGNGLKLSNTPNKASSMIPGMFSGSKMSSNKSMFNKIKNNVAVAVQSKGAPPSVAMVAAQAAEMGAHMGPAGAASEAAKAVLKAAGSNTSTIAQAGNAVAMAVAGSGGASASAGGGGGASATASAAGNAAAAAAVAGGASHAVASVAGAAAAAAAGSAIAIAVAGGGPPAIAVGEPYPIPMPPVKPIFKRQRVSLTASDAGTVRHVVRIQSATPTSKMFGFVIVFGHRSHKHSGRKQFSL